MTQRIVIMGVAGCGKTSVGEALATRLGLQYCDGDTRHSATNVKKMRVAALEPPDDTEAITVDIGPPLPAVAEAIVAGLGVKRSSPR